MKILIMTDGGFRSAFITGLATKECGQENVKTLFIDSGQEAAPNQLHAVQTIAEYYGVPFTAFNLGFQPGRKFRLTNYIFMALSYASDTGCDKVYYGACKVPKASFKYELSHTHLRNLQMLIKSVRLESRNYSLPEPEAPCMLLQPSQISQLGKKMYDVPFHLTWNCEHAGARPCGKCAHCLRWQLANPAPAIVVPRFMPAPITHLDLGAKLKDMTVINPQPIGGPDERTGDSSVDRPEHQQPGLGDIRGPTAS